MHEPSWWTLSLIVLDYLLRTGLTWRIIMRRLPVGVSLAWIMVVLVFPLGGALVYLMIGELRLGDRRARFVKKLERPLDAWLSGLKNRAVKVDGLTSPAGRAVMRIADTMFGIPALVGAHLELLPNASVIFDSLIHDIDSAQSTVHLEFYIWSNGGRADDVAEALLRATKRGVCCRVLLDDVGSRPFLRSAEADRLRAGGIEISRALPVSLFRSLFVRFDLRLHRKIVVIDGTVAYTGSFNLVDPRYFKQSSGVGEWVDAMARVQGPAVEAMAITLLSDWELESHKELDQAAVQQAIKSPENVGDAIVQVLPSGPGIHPQAIEQIVIQSMYSAERELVISTPYFVPEEKLVEALTTAAHGGVEVTLIMPAKLDSKLTGLASRAFIGDLVEAGVRVAMFRGGLLHTKSISIDGEMSLFGSVNLDPRSFHLNFEITLAVYDSDFTRRLRELQQSYIDQSDFVDAKRWSERPAYIRFADNTARLLGPLL